MPKRHLASLRNPSVSVHIGSEQIFVHTPIKLAIHQNLKKYSKSTVQECDTVSNWSITKDSFICTIIDVSRVHFVNIP